jgi:hypothetical protein
MFQISGSKVVARWCRIAPVLLRVSQRIIFAEIVKQRGERVRSLRRQPIPLGCTPAELGPRCCQKQICPLIFLSFRDRLVHNAHRVEMRGDSMRKARGKPSTQLRLPLTEVEVGAHDRLHPRQADRRSGTRRSRKTNYSGWNSRRAVWEPSRKQADDRNEYRIRSG